MVKKLSCFVTIKNTECFEETEKRSKFISYSFPVNSDSEAMDFFKQIKLKHPNARHHVYGYVINGTSERYSDDGEPSGTGGLPIINAIKSMNLSNVLVVVVRYFGGILLGTNRLRMMYGSGASHVLGICEKVKMVLCSRFSVNVDYHKYKKVEFAICKNGAKVLNTEYFKDVKLECIVKKENFLSLNEQLTEILKKSNCCSFLNDEYYAF